MLILMFWSTLARLLMLRLIQPKSTLDLLVPSLPASWGGVIEHTSVTLAALTAIVLGAAYLLGQIDALLNRSSLAAFYSGRLRAAYLGATNFRRWRLGSRDAGSAAASPDKAVDQDDPNDEITLDAYYRRPLLAPLH